MPQVDRRFGFTCWQLLAWICLVGFAAALALAVLGCSSVQPSVDANANFGEDGRFAGGSVSVGVHGTLRELPRREGLAK